MAKSNKGAQAQGAKPQAAKPEPELIDHVVTQEDLDKNPELVEAGVQVVETIQIENPVTTVEQPATTNDGEAKQKGTKSGAVVLKSFRDKDDFNKIYSEGEDVSHLEADRLAHLVSIGYVKA